MSESPTNNEELDELVDEMIDAGETLPDSVREGLVEAGDEATDRLVEVALDGELSRLDARGEGFGPIHAAGVLADRGDEAAIEPLIELLQRPAVDDFLSGAVIDALGEFGERALEEILEAADEAEDGEVRGRLLEAAMTTGLEREAIYDRLVDLLEVEAAYAAQLLGEYGDDRAIEPLQGLLDEVSIKSSKRLFANHEILETAEAIEALGGDFTRKQRRKIAYARRKQREAGSRLSRRLKG